LQEVHRLTEFANRYEDDFVKAIIGHSMKMAEDERGVKQKELERLTIRDKELDTLFEKIYEDNVTGKISDERFSKMTRKYEEEQGELAKRAKVLRAELKKGNRQALHRRHVFGDRPAIHGCKGTDAAHGDGTDRPH